MRNSHGGVHDKVRESVCGLNLCQFNTKFSQAANETCSTQESSLVRTQEKALHTARSLYMPLVYRGIRWLIANEKSRSQSDKKHRMLEAAIMIMLTNAHRLCLLL